MMTSEMNVQITNSMLAELAREFDIDDLTAVPAGAPPVDEPTLVRLIDGIPEELDYLARGLDKRLNPDMVLPGVKSIFVGLVSYAGGPKRPDPLPPGTGWISRYAWFRDYHKTVGKRFKALAGALEQRFGARTLWYVDTGPVLEKTWAAVGGLGFLGRNSLLVSPRYGSFVFLGSILTDIDVSGLPERECHSGCGNCRACIDACPTGALSEDGRLDQARCLGHITVSSRSPVPEDINLAGNVFGCDICQDACPYNRSPAIRQRSDFTARRGMFCPGLDKLVVLNEETFSYWFEGTPVMRRGVQGIRETAARLYGKPLPETDPQDDRPLKTTSDR